MAAAAAAFTDDVNGCSLVQQLAQQQLMTDAHEHMPGPTDLQLQRCGLNL